MRHPTEGVLRRLLDEPAGVGDADREHVAGCDECLALLATVREDAALVGAALAVDSRVDVGAAWERLSTAAARPAAVTAPARTRRRRAMLRHPAVAAVAVAVVLAGAGTAAANRWLEIFRTDRIAPVGLTASDLMALPDLTRYGSVEVTGDRELTDVPDAATAATMSGLDLPEVTTLPRGITGEPAYQVGREMSITFTFSTDRARRAAAEVGGTLPPVPAGLDGSQVRLVVGPGVAAVWSHSTGVPALVVGRAVAPRAFSTGVPFETVRDYLLSLPGMPPEVAARLRTFAADGSTLPLPVPADRVTTSTADVGGVPATVIATKDKTMAAVVWVADGDVTAVAGALKSDEVLAVARGLR